jgi:hypothetical protein
MLRLQAEYPDSSKLKRIEHGSTLVDWLAGGA